MEIHHEEVSASILSFSREKPKGFSGPRKMPKHFSLVAERKAPGHPKKDAMGFATQIPRSPWRF